MPATTNPGFEVDLLTKEPNEEGYLFTLEGYQLNDGFFETITLSDIRDYEQAQLRILQQLIDEEAASLRDGRLFLSHESIAQLDPSDLITLDFPSLYPFDLQIRALGNLARPDFSYAYQFVNGQQQPFTNPKRTGTYLQISASQSYSVVGSLFFLLQAIDRFNSDTEPKSPKKNMIQFSDIKDLSSEVGAILDAYLNKEEVLIPDKLGVNLKRLEDGSIEVDPVLCQRDENTEDEDISFSPVDESSVQESFTTQVDRLNRERDIYSLPGGKRVILDDSQKQAIKQFKKVKRVSGKEKEELLKSPQKFFDPDVVDLDSFSDRVIEIGEYKPKVYPFLHPQKEAWLPPEGGIVIDGALVYVDESDASVIKEKIESAISNGQQSITWKQQQIPATEETIQAIDSYISHKKKNGAGTEEESEGDQEEKPEEISQNKILIIRDNFEGHDFDPKQDQRPGRERMGIPGYLKSQVSLLQHQEEGLSWLQNLWVAGSNGALLADDMGLGKTLQVLCFISWYKELTTREEDLAYKPILVVAPVALLENWKEEYRSFIDQAAFGEFLELYGRSISQFRVSDEDPLELDSASIAQAPVVITTYETLRNYQISLGRIDWSIIVVDEAQKIKTPTAMVTLAVKAMKYEFGISMTGTPVENSWVDLWSVMDFVQPGHLESLKDFVSTYQNPLNRPETDRQELGNRLRQRVDPLLLRRMKEDHLTGLPEKSEAIYNVRMPEEQLKHYLEVVKKASNQAQHSTNSTHVLSLIATLRDISLCPFLPYHTDIGLQKISSQGIIQSSARILKTIEILEEVKGKHEKAIVFVISRKMQRILQRVISDHFGIFPHIVNGQVSGGKRKHLIDAFQKVDGFNVIVVSTEAAGVGLTITKANHVIHLSRAWNPAKEDQATDRVYRIGQERKVTVHIPLAVHPEFDNEICRGSFDEKLHRLLTSKRDLSRSVLMPSIVTNDDWKGIADEVLSYKSTQSMEHPGITGNEIDSVQPINFEELIGQVFRKQNYQVHLTPTTRDFGADVVALPHGNQTDQALLIQCKHTIHPDRAQGLGGIQEVIAAHATYSREYERDFKLMVATNSQNFTDSAVSLAQDNNVELLTRNSLLDLLRQYPVGYGEISSAE